MPEYSESQPITGDQRPKGLNTFVVNRVPRLIERGRVKIGMKGEERTTAGGVKWRPPVRLDHFLITTAMRDAKGDFVRDAALHKVFGDKPTELPIRLLFNDLRLNFQSNYAAYKGKTLWCRGDGKVASRLSVDQASHDWVTCPCFRLEQGYKDTEEGKKNKDWCKIGGRLSFVIEGAEFIGGIWRFITTSFNSVDSIAASLALIHTMTSGHIANIPLWLRVQPKTVQLPNGTQSTIQVVSVEYRGDAEHLRLSAVNEAKMEARHSAQLEHFAAQMKRAVAEEPIIPAEDVEEFNPSVEEGDEPSRAPVGGVEVAGNEPATTRRRGPGRPKAPDTAPAATTAPPLVAAGSGPATAPAATPPAPAEPSQGSLLKPSETGAQAPAASGQSGPAAAGDGEEDAPF